MGRRHTVDENSINERLASEGASRANMNASPEWRHHVEQLDMVADECSGQRSVRADAQLRGRRHGTA